MTKVSKARLALVTVWLLAMGGLATGVATVAAAGKSRSTSGTIWIAETMRPGHGVIYEAGQVKDKMLGEGAISFSIKPVAGKPGTLIVKAVKVTAYFAGGSLTGTGSSTLTITNKPSSGDATASNGHVSLTKGTGALKGHSLATTFTGKGTVTGGVFTFKYKGTYK